MINIINSYLDHNFWIRMVIMNLPIQIGCVAIMKLLLGKMKKPGYLLALIILKGVVMCYLQSFGENLSAAGRMGEIVAGALGGIFVCLLCFWLFEAEPIKILFGIAISEGAATCSLVPAVAIVSMIEKRPESMFSLYIRLQPLDLLSWPIEVAVCLFLYYVLKKFQRAFQAYEFRHVRLIWLIYLAYFLLMQTSQVIGIATEEGIRKGMMVPCMIVAAASLLGVGIVIHRQTEAVKTQGEFLQLELSMMQTQYHAMQYQRAHMEECKELIDRQMQEIMQKAEHNAEHNAEPIRTAAYLDDLNQAYQKIHAGIYCRDWKLDSILYVETERARQENIQVTCKVQSEPKEDGAVQCMEKVLVELFEYAIAECKKISDPKGKHIDVRIDVIASQAVVLLTCPGGKTVSVLKKKINEQIEEQEGSIEIEKSEGKQRICVRFDE